MKKSSAQVFILLSVIPSFLYSSDPIRSADSLINLHKYSSAFELLNQADFMNENREIVFKKMDIALNYFVQSLNHSLFSFKDIGPDEDIVDYRGKEGSSDMFLFPIDSVLLNLLDKYPNDGNIYKRLGDYYQDVLNRYGGRWMISDDSLKSAIIHFYEQAERRKSMDFKSYDHLGIAYFETGKDIGAERCFRASIKLNPKSPDSPYNLAYLLNRKKRFTEALPFAKRSFELYESRSLKSDAGRMCADCYNEMGDHKNALKYLRLTDAIDPNNYYVYRSLLWTFLKMNSMDSALSRSISFFGLQPSNPKLTQDIMADYQEAGHSKEIPKVLGFLRSKFSEDAEASGNVLFHFSDYYQDESKPLLSLAYLDSAEAKFHVCYPDTHYVFKVIDARRDKLRSK